VIDYHHCWQGVAEDNSIEFTQQPRYVILAA
jgi:hypothetical protein